MKSFLKKSALASAVAAMSLASAAPAQADDYRRHNGGEKAALAIGAGILGLAIGAAIASDNDRDRDYRRYDRYGYPDGYYYNGYTYRGGYYWDDYGRRYNRPPRGWTNRHRQWDRSDWSRRGYDSRHYDRRGYGDRYDHRWRDRD